jgi:hypothetical protein
MNECVRPLAEVLAARVDQIGVAPEFGDGVEC